MPFGESFLSTLRSNKSIMIDKSKRFRKTSGGFDWSKSPQFDFPEATPQELERIRKKIKNEQRKSTVKQILVLIVLMLIITSIFIYLIV